MKSGFFPDGESFAFPFPFMNRLLNMSYGLRGSGPPGVSVSRTAGESSFLGALAAAGEVDSKRQQHVLAWCVSR